MVKNMQGFAFRPLDETEKAALLAYSREARPTQSFSEADLVEAAQLAATARSGADSSACALQ